MRIGEQYDHLRILQSDPLRALRKRIPLHSLKTSATGRRPGPVLGSGFGQRASRAPADPNSSDDIEMCWLNTALELLRTLSFLLKALKRLLVSAVSSEMSSVDSLGMLPLFCHIFKNRFVRLGESLPPFPPTVIGGTGENAFGPNRRLSDVRNVKKKKNFLPFACHHRKRCNVWFASAPIPRARIPMFVRMVLFSIGTFNIRVFYFFRRHILRVAFTDRAREPASQ